MPNSWHVAGTGDFDGNGNSDILWQNDNGTVSIWDNGQIPYFQFFTGEEFFQHTFPHERSDLSHWRKRLGDKLELLLAESLRVAHEAGALHSQDLKRVTVDTTVQPKAITFPTDAKLLHGDNSWAKISPAVTGRGRVI